MNEYRQNAIEHLKTHLGCVGYRDYLIAELEKLEKIEQILKDYNVTMEDLTNNEYDYTDLERDIIREVLENG